jgi:hypothetical protein
MPAEAIAAPSANARHLPRIDPRLLPPLLITAILVTAHLSFGILEGYSRTGLAIVAAIAQAHGGTVRADNGGPYGGAVVTLVLPP